ncbi:MAG: PilZ domain-containing protein [Deltaproteobacteria bacterium]|jgi:Tfp pilus assembly protein PilZ|nr:PilZ domain-containing protein [Deltaproteobacteria bacterium]
MELSEEQQKTLIGELELRLSKEKRRHTRKSVTTVVDFASQGLSYREFVQDISESGVFIQTSRSFSEGNEITLIFSLPQSPKQLKIEGRITRVTDRGIGVEFRREGLLDQSSIDSVLKML